ncbi:Borealin N terminal-domain-containing protein [Yarrowia lipolytica]|uniref:Borealin N terminal-domain-containing protein n=1 Tax=Yarrowia lipolytica TaxID=4952 RepID=A0A371C1N6_YARLL|nr:Borealin N terminal-domain-containing protein [Yarrowia lipolytica]RDW34450.1 Borealin N terminal-domain-containing protein [Yarrowia lipolytica]RDW38202.1 Borealin N terminal-domain-containing protein [Yarrowia lipolytica]
MGPLSSDLPPHSTQHTSPTFSTFTMPTEMDQFPSNMARKPLTEVQKNDLIENLQLEREYRDSIQRAQHTNRLGINTVTNRIERLKSQYQFAAQAVRAKIEIRKTRVPKRYWNKTLREVQALQDGALKDRKPNKLNFGQGFHNIPKFTIPHE